MTQITAYVNESVFTVTCDAPTKYRESTLSQNHHLLVNRYGTH